MADEVRYITKQLAAQEDLAFGEGSVVQARNGQSYTVNKIRGFYPCNSLAELNSLDGNRFPKACTVIDGVICFYVYSNGSYSQVAENSSNQTYRGTGISTQGNYVQNGDTIPAGTTHLVLLLNGKPEEVIAWNALTLPAVVTAVPSGDNGFAGYELETDQGTFEFVSQVTYSQRLSGNVLGWGAIGDATERSNSAQSTGTDDYTKINKAIYSDNLTETYIPKSWNGDGYVVGDSIDIVADKQFNMSPATYLMPQDGIVALNISRDDTRRGQRVINNPRIWAGKNPDGTNVTYGIVDLGSLNTEQYNTFVTGCYIGFKQTRTMEFKGNGAVIEYNNLGHFLEQHPVDGGITNMNFSSYRYQQNTVGLLLKSTNSGLPLGNITFEDTLLQGNSHCGMAFYSSDGNPIQNIRLSGGHFEANVVDDSVDDIVIQGVSIPPCTIYAKGCKSIELDGVSFGDNDSPVIIIENTNLICKDLEGFGNEIGLRVENRGNSKIYQTGRCVLTGKWQGLSSYGNPRAIGRGCMHGAPLMNDSVTIRNEYVYSDPFQPTIGANNTLGYSLTSDPETGIKCGKITFDSVIGSTAVNRAQFNILSSPTALDRYEYISFLVKSSIESEMSFYFVGSGGALFTITVGTKWQRIVITNKSNGSNGSLHIFPADTNGAELSITGMNVLTSEDVDSAIAISYSNGAMNFKGASAV